MNDVMIVTIFFLGICLGLWIGWGIWRYPSLKYKGVKS